MSELEETLKNIIQRHTNEEGKFNLSSALVEQENMIRDMSIRLAGCEEALTFFSEWYNRTQRVDILVPESFKKDNGLIL